MRFESCHFEERRVRLAPLHLRALDRFRARLARFGRENRLSDAQIDVVLEHLLRLGERGRNPANTGNIEDLFCHTLIDTEDPIRAFAQALADSVKVVPMDPEARLVPALTTIDRKHRFERVKDLIGFSEADRMLVTHTMVAYGDEEMWSSAEAFVVATLGPISVAQLDREVAKMAVQSQHLPSSSFVLARASGLTLECGPLWARAGYSSEEAADAQAFYDICGTFDPGWSQAFLDGTQPVGEAWEDWRRRFLEARSRLPPELIYQLSSDTLTNFLEGTLESGKWTDASVAFHGVKDPRDVPASIARIVNQYIAEHVALHDRPAEELAAACAGPLAPWGVDFDDGRAVVGRRRPERARALEEQLQAAWARRGSG